MKYILMCGGNYDKFKTPKQLLKVNGEVLIERTIRLLKENGINNIAISTNNTAFNYLDVEILHHNNEFEYCGKKENISSKYSWLNAYYPIDEPCCYLHGDVYFSDKAIKTIINTKVKDTMFFCVLDKQDGEKCLYNFKGREPLGYKVENQKVFRKAINDLLKMVDEGKFKNAIAPISWHLYRYLNGMEYILTEWGVMNNIFKSKGDYVVINDVTTDIDDLNDIIKIEKSIEVAKKEGGKNMIKVEVIEEFTLERFNELKNITRKKASMDGKLFVGDTFDCDEAMAKYLLGNNPLNKAVVRVIEVMPTKKAEKLMEEHEEKTEEPKIEEKPKTTKKKKTSKK